MNHERDDYERLCEHAREVALLESIQGLLTWDERTYLPPAAGAYRADQISYLAGRIHRQRTDPRVGQWLEKLAASPLAEDPHSDTGATIRELRRRYARQVRIPPSLVEQLSRAATLGEQAWVDARQQNDFASLAPLLETIVRLRKQQAEAVGYEQYRYDALLDDFEPGGRSEAIAALLASLRDELVPLVGAIADSRRRPRVDVLERYYPIADQKALGRRAAEAIGFDFHRGRLDVTHHPFCGGAGPDDCRITTRYEEHYFPGAFFGILHEAGHGIYEQGLRKQYFGLPPGSSVSLGIHESQSRMWENVVGRSLGFWRWLFPDAQRTFPDALRDVTLDEFYFAVNAVRPSLIRVEADEATYNLHIIIRFELERALIDDELPVRELPGLWNEKYRQYLGIDPPNDADGVLQDIHWSAALIGYFPTYALGNIYAGQLLQAAERELGPLDPQWARGEFQPLRQWLSTHVYERGQCYAAEELVETVTGQPLTPGPLMNYLRRKLEPLYAL